MCIFGTSVHHTDDKPPFLHLCVSIIDYVVMWIWYSRSNLQCHTSNKLLFVWQWQLALFSSLMMPFPCKLSILQSTMAGYYFSLLLATHIISCFIFFFMLYLDFQGNSVSTTKYSVLTFLPKGLFEQVLIHYFCSSRILPMKQRHYFCILNFICATELNFSFHFLFNKY